MRKPLLLPISLIFIGGCVAVIFLFVRNPLSAELVINEISFTNNDGNDWIEIYNPSLQTKSLTGLYLTDKKEDYTQYEIKEDLIIPPNGFVVIYGQNYTGEETVLKTNFGIKNGETIYLIDQQQRVIDSLTAIADEAALTETTVGHFPDGDPETFIMSMPTKGERNRKDFVLRNNPARP